MANVEGQNANEMPCHAYDILNYNEEVRRVFGKGGEKSTVDQMYSHRMLLLNVIDFMNYIRHPRKARSWEYSDFSDAAGFFKNNYPILGDTLLNPITWLINATKRIASLSERFISGLLAIQYCHYMNLERRCRNAERIGIKNARMMNNIAKEP